MHGQKLQAKYDDRVEKQAIKHREDQIKKAKGYTTATTTEINAVDAGKPTGEDASTTQQVKVTYRSSNGRPLGPAETLVLSVRLVKTGAAWRVTSSTLL